MNKIASRLLLLSTIVCSCQKETSEPQSKPDLLMNKKWKITAQTTQRAGGPVENTYSSLPAYDKDDYFYFKPDSTYTLNANTLKKPGVPDDVLDYGNFEHLNGVYIDLKSTKTPSKKYGLTSIEEIKNDILKIVNIDLQSPVPITMITTYKTAP